MENAPEKSLRASLAPAYAAAQRKAALARPADEHTREGGTARRPDYIRSAVLAPEDPVLELHRSLPRRGRSIPTRAGASSDSASVRALAWPFSCHRVSDRRNAS